MVKLDQGMASTIKSSIPPEFNNVKFLADMFCWTNESTYRRLRCEIPFTFEEIVKICKELNLSIDNVIQLQKTGRAHFDMCVHEKVSPEEAYFEKILYLTQFSSGLNQAKSIRTIVQSNIIPISFSIFMAEFSRYTYYKWLHQSQYIAPNCTMSEVSYPEKFISQHKTWAQTDRSDSYVDFIFDRNMILTTCNELSYFYIRNLINQEELELLRTELLGLVHQLSLLVKSGIAITNAKATVYLSSIDITGCHAYFETNVMGCSQVQVYGLDVLQSYSSDVSFAQKEWLEQQKRYAIPITKCNENVAQDFFNLQRIYINKMGVIQEGIVNY